MTVAAPQELLEQALALSQRAFEAADAGDIAALLDLDAQRLQLLQSARLGLRQVDAGARALLHEIALWNDRAIGAVEHHHRRKAREMDMAAMGRRALAAYSTIQLQR